MRVSVVLWKLVPIVLSFVRDFRRYIFWGTGRTLSEEGHIQRARHLTQTLAELGPTFIKLAQVLSARADVLPPTYLKQLSTLQDKVKPDPTETIKAVISTELHRPPEEVFEDFTDMPLAAASLGQVHRARYGGEDVVVKVLRPRVPQLIQVDLQILFALLTTLNTFISYSPFLRSFTTVLTEFRRVIQEEMNFQLEARHVKMFQHNLAHEKWVLIPKVYDELTTRRVIVLQFLEGVKINQVEKLEQMGIDIDLVIRRLARIYIHQVMIDGLLHADPHPGNILVDSQSRIIILDFGMVIRIDASFKRHLIKYAIALANNDVESMVHEMYELQLVEPGTNKALLRDLAVLMLEIQEQGKISARKVQQMMNALMNAFYEFPFTLPSELVYIARATSLIEGIGFIHDPWFDAVAVGRPIIKEMAKDVLQEELQGGILEILQQWTKQSYHTISALQDSIIKLDREQLRIHLHPSDMQSLSTMMGGIARRIVAGLCLVCSGMILSAIYIRTGNTGILWVGVVGCSLGFIFLLLLPDKIRHPRQQRFLQKQLEMVTTEEGELFKSLVISQMSREEHEKAEAQRQKSSQQ
ncbi:predicted unusual protein kinase [Candidatus Vecturithrix granuli]|uniref:Predicted unusual protein kinase n=1 Tax=Vecturithrix granuli TaxID=1499967 RepID=A0A081BU30_VECG1|nr:predicted unusual protein kinase [Candidatus Vecturithrix granuli]